VITVLRRSVARRLREAGLMVATAESCTGGLLSAVLTAASGSSAWFKGGVVAYSNALKVRLLRVPTALLAAYGAVSRPTALAMAEGVCRATGAPVGVAITGIAGPTGGVPGKPVGTVWIAVRDPAGTVARRYRFKGSRQAVRRAACVKALEMLDARSGLWHNAL